MDEGKRFIRVVEWSEEDGCFVGSAPPLIGRCCHGDSESKVLRELSSIIREWIAIHEAEGRPLPPASAGKRYSGKFVVRVSPEVHQSLTLQALAKGVSLEWR